MMQGQGSLTHPATVRVGAATRPGLSWLTFSWPPWLERALTVFVLLYFAGAVVPSLVLPPEPVESAARMREAQSLLRLLWIPVYVLTLALALPVLPRALRALWRTPSLLLLVAMPLVSVAWSVSPMVTLRRSIGLFATTLVGLYLSARFTQREQLRLLAACLVIILVTSILFAVALPELGQTAGADQASWRGVFRSKNSLGRMMVLTGLVLLMLPRRSAGQRLLAWAGVSLVACVLVFANSATGLAVALLLVAAYFLLRLLELGPVYAVGPLALALVLAVLALVTIAPHVDPLLAGVGRDATLTGRTDLWAEVWQSIQARFWLGYGYGAFWDEAAPGQEIWQVLRWQAPSAHNGLLELWLAMGPLAVALFCVSYSRTFSSALRSARVNPGADAYWPALFLVAFVALSLTESHILEHHDVVWVFYVALAAGAARPGWLSPAAGHRPG